MDHAPIDTAGQEPDVTTLAPRDHGQWPLGAVASVLIARHVSACVDQTGGVICVSMAVTKPLPDRCPVCGGLEIRYGGGHAAGCSSYGHIADEAAFEVGLCEVLAADLDDYGWSACVQVIETGDCLGDTGEANLDPLAPSGAHPQLIADVLLALDWPEVIRRSTGRA